jgi:hypothetical protein
MENVKQARDENGRYIGSFWKCDCGAEVWAYGSDTDCDRCGQMYNSFGQKLCAPEQWEEREDFDY